MSEPAGVGTVADVKTFDVWDNAYDEALRTYQQPSQRESGATALMDLTRGIVRTYLREHRAYPHLDNHARITAEDDALLDILAMADDFDPQRGLTFRQYIGARHAAWRTQTDRRLTMSNQHNDGLNRAENEVWRLAAAAMSAYVNEHGYEPDDATLLALVGDCVTAKAARSRISVEEQQARNNKSGFTAALRNLPEIRRTRTHVTLEHVDRYTSSPDAETAVVEQQACNDLLAFAGLSATDGDYDQLNARTLNEARARMSSPHTQWLYHAPKELISVIAPA